MSVDLSSFPEDMKPMLNTGKYTILNSETTGENYVFPLTKEEEIEFSNQENKKNPSKPQKIVIPQVFLEGTFKWIPRDENILNMRYSLRLDDEVNYVGRFSYEPESGEFLPSLLSIPHCVTIQKFGSYLFNEYVRGIFIKPKGILMIRSYFNPLDANGKFDPYGFYTPEVDKIKTEKTLRMLLENGLPSLEKILAHVSNNKIIEKYVNFV